VRRDYESTDLASAAHLARDEGGRDDRPHPSEYMDFEALDHCWACGLALPEDEQVWDCPRCGERL
jgi:rubrerythrin